MSGTGSKIPSSHPGVSGRLTDQRHRNRIVEVIETLAEGPQGVRTVGLTDFLNDFFMLVPDDCVPHPNSTLTREEVLEIENVCRTMSAAIAAMPMGTRDNAFIEGGWADEIGSVAEKALSVFLRRGRFDEEKEEVEPSG